MRALRSSDTHNSAHLCVCVSVCVCVCEREKESFIYLNSKLQKSVSQKTHLLMQIFFLFMDLLSQTPRCVRRVAPRAFSSFFSVEQKKRYAFFLSFFLCSCAFCRSVIPLPKNEENLCSTSSFSLSPVGAACRRRGGQRRRGAQTRSVRASLRLRRLYVQQEAPTADAGKNETHE